MPPPGRGGRMTAVTPALELSARPAAGVRAWRFVRRHVLDAYALLALVYLFVPISVVVAFSFNNPLGRFNYTWQGFTLKSWTHPFNYPGIGGAVRISIEIAFLSSLAATVLGTLIALALVRYRFRGSATTNLLIFIPMTTPEIVMGTSLLTLFLNWKVPQGFGTILIAHIMFNISYVVVTVRARLVGFDRHLEEAAMDLGANELATFSRVTLPLIAPGIMAAGLLAFALSIDDFVITYFNAGTTTTFPLFVWGAARVAVPPQINVIGTAIFGIAVGGMLANIFIQNRRARRAA
jgi:spermidine/putrescine transport system permease protein